MGRRQNSTGEEKVIEELTNLSLAVGIPFAFW
jgi:hypothetical protein